MTNNPWVDIINFLILSSFLISCCLASALLTQSPHLSIKQPSEKPIDREVQIQVERLEPFQEIEIKAEALDQKGNLLWFSIGGNREADAKAYEFLLKTINFPASEIVFIDDKTENVEAAKKLGIDATLFESLPQLREKLVQREILSQ